MSEQRASRRVSSLESRGQALQGQAPQASPAILRKLRTVLLAKAPTFDVSDHSLDGRISRLLLLMDFQCWSFRRSNGSHTEDAFLPHTHTAFRPLQRRLEPASFPHQTASEATIHRIRAIFNILSNTPLDALCRSLHSIRHTPRSANSLLIFLARSGTYTHKALPSAGAVNFIQSFVCTLDNPCLNDTINEEINRFPQAR